MDESNEEYRIPMKRTFVEKYIGGTPTTSNVVEHTLTVIYFTDSTFVTQYGLISVSVVIVYK